MAHLEGEAAVAWASLLGQLIRVARPGSLYPDAARLLQLLDFCARVAPRKTQAAVQVSPTSGLPASSVLEKLTAMQEVAASYLRDHGAKPTRAAQGWSTSLAAAELPPLVSTHARLVSKEGGTRRFLVVHDRWTGPFGAPARFTFHLTDTTGKYLGVDRAEQAQVKEPLRLAIEIACRESAELAYLQLAAMKGIEAGEVVMGQVGPFEAPAWVANHPSPLKPFLHDQPPTGILHLVLERAASGMAADVSLDPFIPLDAGPDALKRRAAFGFHVSRERRLCCTVELQRPLQTHLKSLGASLIVRSR